MFHISSVLPVRSITSVYITSEFSLHKVALQVSRVLLVESLFEWKNMFSLLCTRAPEHHYCATGLRTWLCLPKLGCTAMAQLSLNGRAGLKCDFSSRHQGILDLSSRFAALCAGMTEVGRVPLGRAGSPLGHWSYRTAGPDPRQAEGTLCATDSTS